MAERNLYNSLGIGLILAFLLLFLLNFELHCVASFLSSCLISQQMTLRKKWVQCTVFQLIAVAMAKNINSAEASDNRNFKKLKSSKLSIMSRFS